MIEETLASIGLTNNEIVIYKSLLILGSTTTGPLTKKVGIHRSRVYESLNRLIKKGIVSYTIKSNKKYFEAQDPSSLLRFLDEKRTRVKEILPELKEMQKEKKEILNANVFEGFKGVKSVLNNILSFLNSEDEVLVLGASGGQYQDPKIWELYFKSFNKKRINKGIKYKVIFNENLRKSEIVNVYANSKLTNVKFLDEKTPVGITIFKDNIAIIKWTGEPHAFMITSKEVAQSFREYFRSMWKISKK